MPCNNFNFNKKAISSLIATVLIVLVSVVLIAGIVSFSKDFTTGNLDESSVIKYDSSLLDGFIESTSVYENNSGSESKIVLRNNNSEKDLNIVSYKIIDPDATNTSFLDTEYTLDSSVIVSTGSSNQISIKCIPSKNFTLELITSDGAYVTVPVSYLGANLSSCENYVECGDGVCSPSESYNTCSSDCDLSLSLKDTTYYFGSVYDVKKVGNYVVYLGRSEGISSIVSYSLDGNSLSVEDIYNFSGSANSFYLDEDTNNIYVGNETNSSLLIFELNSSGEISLISDNNLSHGPSGICKNDNYIFLNYGYYGLGAATLDNNIVTEQTYFFDEGVTNAQDMICDNNYIYLSNNYWNGVKGIKILSYDGNSFSEDFSISNATAPKYLTKQGNYLFLTEYNNEMIRVYNFDGTFLTNVTSYTGSGTRLYDIFSDDNYIFASDINSVKAFSFNGTTLSLLDTYEVPNSNYINHIYFDGTNLFSSSNTLSINSFDGSSFSNILNENYYGFLDKVEYISENELFLVNLKKDNHSIKNGVMAFSKYDGSSFNLLDYLETNTYYYFYSELFPNIYLTNGTDISAYSYNTSTNLFGSEVGSISISEAPIYIFPYLSSGGTDYILSYRQNSIQKYSFNGSTFSGPLGNSHDGYYYSLYYEDGFDYFYGSKSFNLFDALSYDGSTFTILDTISIKSYDPIYVDSNEEFIYVLVDGSLNVYTFNGTVFSLIDSYTFDSGNIHPNIYYDFINDQIIVFRGVYGFTIFEFDGNELSVVYDHVADVGRSYLDGFYDGTYYYFVNGNSISVYEIT